MTEEIKYGILFLIIGISVLSWLIIGKPSYPIKNYFLKGYLIGIFSILIGIFLFVKPYIYINNNSKFGFILLAIGIVLVILRIKKEVSVKVKIGLSIIAAGSMIAGIYMIVQSWK